MHIIAASLPWKSLSPKMKLNFLLQSNALCIIDMDVVYSVFAGANNDYRQGYHVYHLYRS
jgi:hypothetical protein